MRRIVQIFAILLLAGTCNTHAENITITTPITVNSVSVQHNLLHLNFSRPLEIDSGWIVSPQDTANKILVFHAKNKDYINISKLGRGYYRFFAQAGDTCYTQLFTKRDTANTKPLDILTEDAVLVSPHQLQFFIREAGKTDPPYVDSLWIVRKNYYCMYADTICMRASVQSCETIDIKPLLGCSENEFQCIAWINGNDYWSNSFYYCGECEEYEQMMVSFTNLNPHHLIVHISNGEETTPAADSLWVTSRNADYRTLLTRTHLADGDTIDLAPMVGLTENYYLAWLRWGDCVKVYEFSFNGLEYDYCLEAGVWWVHVETESNTPVLRYYLRDYANQDIEDIHVDSVWVMTWTYGEEDTPKYVCSLQGQPQEDIDISALKKGFYELYVQTGECIVSMPFQVSQDNVSDTNTAKDLQPSAKKALQNGQILILRGGKTYTLTGQETQL